MQATTPSLSEQAADFLNGRDFDSIPVHELRDLSPELVEWMLRDAYPRPVVFRVIEPEDYDDTMEVVRFLARMGLQTVGKTKAEIEEYDAMYFLEREEPTMSEDEYNALLAESYASIAA